MTAATDAAFDMRPTHSISPAEPGRQARRTPSESRTTQLIAACVAVSVIGSGLYYSSEPPIAGRVWETTIGSLLILMMIGIVAFQGGRRAPWLAIWAGLSSAFVGGLLAAHPALSPINTESPSIVDVLRLMNYPLGALGVLILMFRADRRVGWRASLESALLIGSGAAVIWTTFLQPLAAESDLSTAAGRVAVAYPLADLLLLAVLVVLVMHLDNRPGPLLLVVAALTGNLAADVAFGAQSLRGEATPGTFIDIGWLLCFAAFAAAPSWPASPQTRLVADDGRLGVVRLSLLIAGAILVPAIAVAQTLSGRSPDSYLLVSGLALSALALGRLAVFNHDLDRGRAHATQLASDLADNNAKLRQSRLEQRQLLDRVHTLIEQERTKIATEIHDRPLQNLVSVGYQLQHLTVLLDRGDTDAATDIAERASTQLAAQLGELRDLMTDIRPPVLDASGLTGALADRAAAVEADHPELSVIVRGDCGRLDTDLETALYRITNEALANVIRHSQATTATLTLCRNEDHVTLTCADDGIGFDPQSVDGFVSQGHFGIAGIRERIELLAGAVTIASAPSGTTLVLTAPIDRSANANRTATTQ